MMRLLSKYTEIHAEMHLCWESFRNMKAMLYLKQQKDPVATFDEVQVVEMNDNHSAAPVRLLYKTRNLNSGETMIELSRDEKFMLELDDGRNCSVLLQHSSLDMQGNSVGILRVLGNFPS